MKLGNIILTIEKTKLRINLNATKLEKNIKFTQSQSQAYAF